MRSQDTTSAITTPPAAPSAESGDDESPYAAPFARLGDILHAAGENVALFQPFPRLPDPESPRERYRRATIEQQQRARRSE